MNPLVYTLNVTKNAAINQHIIVDTMMLTLSESCGRSAGGGGGGGGCVALMIFAYGNNSNPMCGRPRSDAEVTFLSDSTIRGHNSSAVLLMRQ